MSPASRTRARAALDVRGLAFFIPSALRSRTLHTQGTFFLDPPVKAEGSCLCSGLLGARAERDTHASRLTRAHSAARIIPYHIVFMFLFIQRLYIRRCVSCDHDHKPSP